MRSMSFMLTTEQVKSRAKTVTRRLGWWKLKVGDHVQAAVKCMGLKKGEKQEKLATIRIVSVRSERLDTIGQADVNREGFPGMSPAEFVSMFCDHHHKCTPETFVNRIEFEYVEVKA